MSKGDLFEIEKRAADEALALFASNIYEVDIMLYKVFSSRQGKRALEYMDSVASQPGADPNLGFENGAAFGFAREGQKQLVYDIKTRMERAKLGAPKTEDSE